VLRSDILYGDNNSISRLMILPSWVFNILVGPMERV